MIVKVLFGTGNNHVRIVECNDVHMIHKGEYTEMILHQQAQEHPKVIHLGKKSRDHVYIMVKGETIDKIICEDHRDQPSSRDSK